VLHDPLRGAAKKNMLETSAAVRWRHNEIGGNLLGQSADFIKRGPTGSDVTVG
jgi:hypothetical protein